MPIIKHKYICKNCKKEFYSVYSYNSILGKTKQFCSKKCFIEFQPKMSNKGWFKKGKRPNIETEFSKGSIPWNKGLERPEMSGKNHWNWKGGITSWQNIIRHSLKYKKFRTKVFKRDNYICQICGQRGGKLNADHIKPFSLYPELRFEMSNMRTVCEECHRKLPTFAGRIKNYVTN